MSSEKSPGFRVLRLQASNVKRLRAVDITPDPKSPLVIVGGNNGEGKTSALDSILYGLGGKDAVAKDPIRHGQKKAFVRVDLGRYIATRRFTPTGQILELKTREGLNVPSPQGFLDNLASVLNFDPLEFSRMKAAMRFETLSSLVHIEVDLDKLATKRKSLYDSRTDLKRKHRDFEGELRQTPEPDANLPSVKIDVAALLADKNRREGLKRLRREAGESFRQKSEALAVAIGKHDEIKSALEGLPPIVAAQKDKTETLDSEHKRIGRELESASALRDDLSRQLRDLQAKLAEQNTRVAELSAGFERTVQMLKSAIERQGELEREPAKLESALTAQQDKIANLMAEVDLADPAKREWPDDDTSDVDAQIAAAPDINASIDRAAQYRERARKLGTMAVEIDKHSEQIEALDQQKEDALAAAEFPIPGLSFADGDVSYNGVLFEQLSSAEQLRVSLAMAMAMNPQLRVILIKDGSLLDETSLSIIREMAELRGYQIWLEVVGNRADATVIIEDGAVVGADEHEPAVAE